MTQGHELLTNSLFFLGNYSTRGIRRNGEWENEAEIFNKTENLLVHYLPIITKLYEYYPQFKGEFGELEFSFLDLWINILPALDEILHILNKMNSKFIIHKTNPENIKWRVYTIMSMDRPRLTTDPENSHYPWSLHNPKAFRFGFIDSLTYKEEYKNMLYLWIQTKVEYKFRIKELPTEKAIELVMSEVTHDFKMAKWHFLLWTLWKICSCKTKIIRTL